MMYKSLHGVYVLILVAAVAAGCAGGSAHPVYHREGSRTGPEYRINGITARLIKSGKVARLEIQAEVRDPGWEFDEFTIRWADDGKPNRHCFIVPGFGLDPDAQPCLFSETVKVRLRPRFGAGSKSVETRIRVGDAVTHRDFIFVNGQLFAVD